MWIAVLLAVCGLYLLCMGERLKLERGDFYIILCALAFSFHILAVGYYAPRTDGVKLACLQFLVSGAVGMLFMFMMVSQASWFHVIVIAIIVVFLSFGAPNQPGSILIGTLIIALFLKADVLIPTAVYLEVFFGGIQNMINVTGDVVTIAIEEKHVWK